jgi:hypothetical protein
VEQLQDFLSANTLQKKQGLLKVLQAEEEEDRPRKKQEDMDFVDVAQSLQFGLN